MRYFPGPEQTWCFPAFPSSELTLTICSVLKLPVCYVEAVSNWSPSLAEAHNFGFLVGKGHRNGSDAYVEWIRTVTPLVCLTTTLGEERKQVMEVKCWSRLVGCYPLSSLSSVTVADIIGSQVLWTSETGIQLTFVCIEIFPWRCAGGHVQLCQTLPPTCHCNQHHAGEGPPPVTEVDFLRERELWNLRNKLHVIENVG